RNSDRLEGTCRWFPARTNFQMWRQGETSSLLWVSADPGRGKSVLSKSLVNIELKSTESRTTCYFFFKDDNDEQKSAANALCSLLHQLFSQKKCLIGHAVPAFKNQGKPLAKSFYTLWGILTGATTDSKAGEIICILDALDECHETDRHELLEALNHFYEKVARSERDKSQLRFLVTGRPCNTIERKFTLLTHNMPTVRLRGEMESETISREIIIVIKGRVPEIAVKLQVTDPEKSILESELLSMPHRTYLWLKLIVEEIESSILITGNTLKETTRRLPHTVEEAYEAILEKITDRERAQKLLCIVISAVRPLTLGEINVALAIEDHHRSIKELGLELIPEIGFETTLRYLCSLFVSVKNRKVYLIHQTAKEFLLAKTKLPAPGGNIHFNRRSQSISLQGPALLTSSLLNLA
ncbi:hypothetical protein AOQ84DRAFT_402705, partial [Glonium stellatum]